MSLSRGGRTAVVALGIGLLAAVALYVALSLPGSDDSATAQDAEHSTRPVPEVGAMRLGGDLVVVRGVDPAHPEWDGPLYELSVLGRVRHVGGSLKCRRVHVTPSGSGLCIRVSRNGFDYEAVTLDSSYRPTGRFPVDGVPSRVRVSPDGRYGAYTMFVGTGRGYFADTSLFSTETRIVDMATGRRLLRLEDLEIRDGGRRLDIEEGELWGVTFGTEGRYMATLALGRDHLLIEGRVGSRRARVIGRDIECPSLSAEGDRIAFKRRIGNRNRWRLYVRELDTGRDIPLAETRSIDDQPEWFGDDLVGYSDGKRLYAVPSGGGDEPEVVADRATSPAASF